jgi:hypothetical protein
MLQWYPAMLAHNSQLGHTSPKPQGAGLPEPAASSEAAHGRMSHGGCPGTLCGMCDGTTLSTHMANTHAPEAVSQQDTHFYFRCE